MLGTAEGITIWSCFPRAPYLVGKVEAEGGYSTIREPGLSGGYRAKGDGSWGKREIISKLSK